MAHPFICPNCGHRTTELDRNIGFTRERKGCEKCGFAFLFELLDDYYPAPDAAFFVCDAEARVIGCGKNAFEFTGVEEEDVIGRSVQDVLGLKFQNSEDPLETVLEWGERKLDVPVQVSGERDVAAGAKADMFPAYDDDGGLGGSAARPTTCGARRTRGGDDRREEDAPGPRPEGRRAADLQGQADGAGEGRLRNAQPRDRHPAQAGRQARRVAGRNPA
jgi:hypothetical protein